MLLPLSRFAQALAVAAAAVLGSAASAQGASSAPVPSAPVAGGIGWSSLSAEQKTALAPLAAQWPTLNADQQRKWIALAHNFNRMSPEERSTLQGRMSEWAGLSAAQRTQARLNFGEARRLPADEKKAKWEEYQSLSPEERQRLADDRPKPPAGTAAALRPVSPEKILRTPATAPGMAGGAQPPLSVNRNTLLPRVPSSAAAPAH